MKSLHSVLCRVRTGPSGFGAERFSRPPRSTAPAPRLTRTAKPKPDRFATGPETAVAISCPLHVGRACKIMWAAT
jgi:hypothetical protein